MTVYVPHNSGQFDVEDATRYGALRVIFRRDLFPDEVDDQMPSLVARAERALAEFDPDEDYLCLLGSPVYMALCSFILGRKHAAIRLLRFDRLERCYYEIAIGDIEELADVEDQGN